MHHRTARSERPRAIDSLNCAPTCAVLCTPVQGQPVQLSAAMFICETVAANPGRVTLLALASLTNVAMAMKHDPTLAANLVRCCQALLRCVHGALDTAQQAGPRLQIRWQTRCQPAATPSHCESVVVSRAPGLEPRRSNDSGAPSDRLSQQHINALSNTTLSVNSEALTSVHHSAKLTKRSFGSNPRPDPELP